MQTSKDKIFRFVKSLVFALLFFFLGTYFGFSNTSSIDKVIGVDNKTTPADASTVDFEPFWTAWNIINEKYPEQVDDQEKIWGAIQGLAFSLGDPYTEFFPPEENKSFGEEITGEFGGIGVEIDIKEGDLVVITPLAGSAAEKSGVKSGDKIIAIDGTSTNGLGIEESISLIRGEIGTSVVLTVVHKDREAPENIKVTREKVTVPTVSTNNEDPEIFIINLYSFSLHADKEFRDALQSFLNSGKSKLIIDLRGNPGGYLEHAIDISSWFLKAGESVVVESGKDGNNSVFRSRGYNLFGEGYDIVILVDGGSASASEIFAGAMQEYKKATLVGEQTYGKGSVQELVPITKDTSLKITVAKWLTPNGVSISESGLTPDYIVPITQEDIKLNRDPQMLKAKEILKQ